jgi:hypothetical protein
LIQRAADWWRGDVEREPGLVIYMDLSINMQVIDQDKQVPTGANHNTNAIYPGPIESPHHLLVASSMART